MGARDVHDSNDAMREPLKHIARTPLPWRESGKTVCGKLIAQYADGLVMSLEDAAAMSRSMGKQRFALVICMTCAHNANRWTRWEDNPVARMEREVTGGAFGKREPIFDHELRSIADLIAAHREEFDARVESYANGDVVTIADLRRKRNAT